MLSNQCKDCKHVVWLVALGQGVRCKHPDIHPDITKLPPLVSSIIDCKLHEKANNDTTRNN